MNETLESLEQNVAQQQSVVKNHEYILSDPVDNRGKRLKDVDPRPAYEANKDNGWW